MVNSAKKINVKEVCWAEHFADFAFEKYKFSSSKPPLPLLNTRKSYLAVFREAEQMVIQNGTMNLLHNNIIKIMALIVLAFEGNPFHTPFKGQT